MTARERQRAWYRRFRAAGGHMLSVQADKETYAQLRAYADKHGLSIQSAVLKIIKEHA